MCVDFKGLYKACPTDSFPLPRIHQLVDATVGHEFLSMMDAFSGYNQIKMHPGDQECTTFTTDKGLYCYNVMPFGLKNAGTTYQRLMNAMFVEHLGKIIEVYMDDMLIKSIKVSGHVANLRIIFSILLAYSMRLNLEKCFFGVTASKFLGYIISKHDKEAILDKVHAILNMKSLEEKVHVQSLQDYDCRRQRYLHGNFNMGNSITVKQQSQVEKSPRCTRHRHTEIGRDRFVSESDMSKWLLCPKEYTVNHKLWKIQTDKKKWPDDPLGFKPERFLTTHKDVDVKGQHFEFIPFGSGRRACPGLAFGIQMVQFTLASFLHAFQVSTLPENAPIDMTKSLEITNVKATPLEVLIKPHFSH
ncbi:parthenolide synthase-like [Rosa chinensis]|uniref:parthenolide synthase-like n=1 Tax=Rosa chinensis TaxID=74649 RepID=UPI000D091BBD|nr:parthenolide synthase-like [Rosa chinensis]